MWDSTETETNKEKREYLWIFEVSFLTAWKAPHCPWRCSTWCLRSCVFSSHWACLHHQYSIHHFEAWPAVKAFRWQMDSHHYTHYLRSSLAFFVVTVVYPQACCERVINKHFSWKRLESIVNFLRFSCDFLIYFSWKGPETKLKNQSRSARNWQWTRFVFFFFRTTSASRGRSECPSSANPNPGSYANPSLHKKGSNLATWNWLTQTEQHLNPLAVAPPAGDRWKDEKQKKMNLS